MTDSINDKEINSGIAGKLAAYFIDSRLTILIIVFAFLAGITAFLFTPREENPQIIVPAANIIVAKPGASQEKAGINRGIRVEGRDGTNSSASPTTVRPGAEERTYRPIARPDAVQPAK